MTDLVNWKERSTQVLFNDLDPLEVTGTTEWEVNKNDPLTLMGKPRIRVLCSGYMRKYNTRINAKQAVVEDVVGIISNHVGNFVYRIKFRVIREKPPNKKEKSDDPNEPKPKPKAYLDHNLIVFKNYGLLNSLKKPQFNSMTVKLIRNDCKDWNKSSQEIRPKDGAYSMTVGVIGIPKEKTRFSGLGNMKINDNDNDDDGNNKKATNVENFLNTFQHFTKTRRWRLSDMMKLHGDFKDILTYYMTFSNCHLVYECSFGKKQESTSVPLYWSSTFDKEHCISIKNDDSISVCISYETKYYPKYILYFLKNSSHMRDKVIGQSVRKNEFKNGKIILDFKNYDYFFALEGAQCTCDNDDEGFFYDVEFT